MCLDTPKRKSGVAVGSKNQGEDGKRRPPRLYKATYKATLLCSTSPGNAATPKYEIWKNWPQCAVVEGTPAVVGHRPLCDLGEEPLGVSRYVDGYVDWMIMKCIRCCDPGRSVLRSGQIDIAMRA